MHDVILSAGQPGSAVLTRGDMERQDVWLRAGLVTGLPFGADVVLHRMMLNRYDVVAAGGGAFEIVADPGIYAITGLGAELLRGAGIVAEPGSYLIVGADASLTVTGLPAGFLPHDLWRLCYPRLRIRL